eukprot:CAMPEP_0114161522 /NCGR_PEP_ID=MMETSP0043_2-20121206/28980_1 /TAXON_ID=464988 /ORGANISM="Hemiselmis andersenii, Strain CCMP644" /LENGTH=190 /DNA_ID=CAMNT_0001257723 /DNA_START=7 /DNA_END=581 /DNA_ORIENTATION=+
MREGVTSAARRGGACARLPPNGTSRHRATPQGCSAVADPVVERETVGHELDLSRRERSGLLLALPVCEHREEQHPHQQHGDDDLVQGHGEEVPEAHAPPRQGEEGDEEKGQTEVGEEVAGECEPVHGAEGRRRNLDYRSQPPPVHERLLRQLLPPAGVDPPPAGHPQFDAQNPRDSLGELPNPGKVHHCE